jgi:predicted RNA polymerase sigma factor
MIREGVALVVSAMSTGRVGEYQLLAAVTAVHDEAARAEDTDWPQVLGLYTVLERISGNPMVSLNRAIAVAMVQGAAAGLAALEPLDERLPGHYRVDATRGHLLEMAGDAAAGAGWSEQAAEHYLAAAGHYAAASRCTTSIPERDHLATQAARLRHLP